MEAVAPVINALFFCAISARLGFETDTGTGTVLEY